MSGVRHAVAVGVRRGWTEFVLSVRSGQDQSFYLVVAVAVLTYLWFNRAQTIDAPGLSEPLSYAAVALPSMVAGMLVFSLVVGPAYALALEREDGTLLRSRTAPYGVVGYVAGQVVNNVLAVLPLLLVLLVPGILLFDVVVPATVGGWLLLVLLVALGVLACLPIGLVVGALVPSAQKVQTWGMLPIVVLFGISGVVVPLQALWGWVQVVGQGFPMYWLGIGLRSVFLPEVAASAEITGSWRTGETIVVLAVWAVVGLLVLPAVLRRMVRRQSGSVVASARQQATQVVR